MSNRDLAMAAMEAALERKALEPVLLDVSDQSTYTDFILLVSGRSDRHVQAVADAVADTMRAERGRVPIGSEGSRDGKWALLDYGDIVVHVFYHPVREFYDLEGLWVDAPRVPIKVPAEARFDVQDAYGM